MINKLSKLSIGTSAYGSRVSDIESIKIIKKLLDSGITKIDTSPFYGFGYSEYNVGKSIQNYNRENLSISSKFGITAQKIPNLVRRFYPVVKKLYSIPGLNKLVKNKVVIKNDEILSLEQIQQSISRSLYNLNTTYLDCLHIHTNLISYLSNEGVVDYLYELKNKFVINKIGITASKIDDEFLKIISDNNNFIDIIQIPYKEYSEDFNLKFKVNYYSIFSSNSFIEHQFIQNYHTNNGDFIILNTNLAKVEKRINHFNKIL